MVKVSLAVELDRNPLEEAIIHTVGGGRMRRKYIRHPELILCPECKNTVSENWLVRHIKSGCKVGGICYVAPEYNSRGNVRWYRKNDW